MAVPLGATYRITGDGIRASDDFELQGTCGDPINLEVHARARGTFIGGIVMMSVGGATISSAFLYLLLAGFGDDPNARDRGGREQPDALAFGIAIGVGAGLIAAGLPVTLTNRRSLVMTPGERIEPAGGGMTAAAGVRRAPDSVLITPISISF